MNLTHKKIEVLRILMHEVALDKELTDQRVLSVSRKLDVLINDYYSMATWSLKPAV